MKNQELITILGNCAWACEYCASACLNEQDVKMLAACISIDRDCALICKTAATLLQRESQHGKHLLKECIEICEACATECEKHTGMEHCQRCAKVCRECADVCRAK